MKNSACLEGQWSISVSDLIPQPRRVCLHRSTSCFIVAIRTGPMSPSRNPPFLIYLLGWFSMLTLALMGLRRSKQRVANTCNEEELFSKLAEIRFGCSQKVSVQFRRSLHTSHLFLLSTTRMCTYRNNLDASRILCDLVNGCYISARLISERLYLTNMVCVGFKWNRLLYITQLLEKLLCLADVIKGQCYWELLRHTCLQEYGGPVTHPRQFRSRCFFCD